MTRSALTPLGRLLITSGGLGFMRPFSGTWGSLPTVLLAAALLALGAGPAHAGPIELEPARWGIGAWLLFHALLLATLVKFALACLVYGDAAEAHWDEKDPPNVVADETAGMCLPLLFLPAASLVTPARAATTLGLAFLAFRFFDIVKLPPARRLQKIPGGLGILIDDLVAGAQAMIVVQAATRLLY
jgi:phosphatidylglycerophosphatase A